MENLDWLHNDTLVIKIMLADWIVNRYRMLRRIMYFKYKRMRLHMDV